LASAAQIRANALRPARAAGASICFETPGVESASFGDKILQFCHFERFQLRKQTEIDASVQKKIGSPYRAIDSTFFPPASVASGG